MDWWSFLTHNGHGSRSLHIEYQTCTSSLRWCTTDNAWDVKDLHSLDFYLVSTEFICFVQRDALFICALHFRVWISTPQRVHDELSDPGSSYNGRHKRHWPSCNGDHSHIDWAIVWWWSMASIRCVNSLHTRWYAIRDCSCLFLERIPGCWGWSAK